MVIVEFSTPTFSLFRKIYMNYLMKWLPKIAKKTASNPEAYVYLAESIRAWPDQSALARKMSANGWQNPTWINLTGGVVAVHTGIKGS
jgi:demethylmenaquinone methyltransferase/2-methoxy-6-polyprenyl-1,4-benzoquinol methylase